jgi:hypothetical protein
LEPGAETTASRVGGSATPWSLPLSPERAPQPEPNPTNKPDQHLGGLQKPKYPRHPTMAGDAFVKLLVG